LADISSMLNRQRECVARRKRHFTGDIPDEAGQFTGNGGENTRLRFSSSRKITITLAEPCLRFPGDVFDRNRPIVAACRKGIANLFEFSVSGIGI